MQYIAPTTCVLPYFCRSSGGGSKVKPEIAPIEARSVADRGSLQLYVFYHTSVASSTGQCNTSLQLRVFYRTSAQTQTDIEVVDRILCFHYLYQYQ